MFTWICPKCGTEVPPSYDECPKCSGKLDELASKEPLTPVEPPTFGSVAPPPPPAPGAPTPSGAEIPAYHHPPEPPPKPGMPPWLVTLLVAGGLIAVIGGGMHLYNQRKAAAAAAAAAAATTAPLPGRAESEPIKPHPYAKFIEISGVRITEENAKPKADVVVINHSGAELPPLDILVHLVAVTAKGESEPEATFTLKVPSLPAYSSKDITVDMQTNKRAYELADWQFLRAEFQILTPAQ